MGDLEVDGRIILKFMLNKEDLIMGRVAGFCKGGNDTLGSVKAKELFLDPICD